MKDIQSKLPLVGTTIFTIMSQMSAQHQAINLAQGFPGFDCDAELQHLVTTYMAKGHNQYAPMTGIPQLREALVAKTLKLYGVAYDVENETTIVSGATEANFCAITAMVRTGDEVLILEPAYDSYVPVVVLCGGIPVFVPLQMPDFSVPWDRVKSSITHKTRLIIVNTPHNPTGYVWTKADLDELANCIRDREIYIVSDEVYEHITFDNRPHLSLMTHAELREKTFINGSFGKTFHITGWKTGYCLAPSNMTQEFRKVHQYVAFSTATPFQFALAEYLKNPVHYEDLATMYAGKRDLFCKGLADTPFEFTPAQGSFFQTVHYGHFSDKNDFAFASYLTKEVGVSAIPVSAFFHDSTDLKMLRFCFAKNDKELMDALEKLKSIS